MTVAEKIKAIIKEEGYKQYAVAKKTSFSEKRFNALLNGKKTFIVDYLPEICRAINKSPSEIFDYEPEQTKGA